MSFKYHDIQILWYSNTLVSNRALGFVGKKTLGGGLLGAKYVCLVLKVRDYNLVKLCEWIVLKITFPSLTRGFNTTNLLNGKIYTTPISLSLIFYFVEVKEKIFTLR
jgi:hypothetical protein